MKSIIVELLPDRTFRATLGGRKIAIGLNQNVAAWRARQQYPGIPIFAARIINSKFRKLGPLRRVYPKKTVEAEFLL